MAFEKRQLTKGAVASARACILDAIGVTLAGYPEPCTQILLKTPGIATVPGPALILGSSRRTSALDAALINGTASHALDFDDFSGIMGGHHSVPLVSTLFALAEERGGSGEDLIAAYVIGVEVEIRLARGQFSSLRQGLASNGDARHFRCRGRRLPPHEARSCQDDDGAVHRGLARKRAQGQFRHHDEAPPHRSVLPQWPACGSAGGGRI
ncbi:MmgE/PrpD family protein [Bradyrhizobium sp. AUGA SZCCT0169]|nr:MmgE/PrpD family protein [Bradyrhizobium sp. AUGA SZCCT0169]